MSLYQSQFNKFSKQNGIKVTILLFLGVTLITQGSLDPTLLNPMHSFMPIHNWLHLPGALAAGFFLDIFGYSLLASLTVSLFSFIQKKNNLQILLNTFIFQASFSFGVSGLLFKPNLISCFGGILGSSFYAAIPIASVKIIVSLLFLYITVYITIRRSLDFSCLIYLHKIFIYIYIKLYQTHKLSKKSFLKLYFFILQIPLSSTRNRTNKETKNNDMFIQKRVHVSSKIETLKNMDSEEKEITTRKKNILKIKELAKKLEKRLTN